MGVELAPMILVRTGVEAFAIPMRGWMRVFCFEWLAGTGLRFTYILTYKFITMLSEEEYDGINIRSDVFFKVPGHKADGRGWS